MSRQSQRLIWNPSVETAPRERLRETQLERLRLTVQRVYQNVPMYRERMQKKGLSPIDIRTLDDLRLLPFTEKTDLRDQYPYGLFAAPRREIVRIQGSSGTTGRPIVAGYTARDIDLWSELMARTLTAAGATNEDTIQIAYGYGLFTGGLGAHQGAGRIGATVVPMSSGNTERQIALMRDLGANILCCTPSYALHIAETIHEKGIPMSEFRLRAGCFGAEPWSEAMRARIEDLLEIDATDIYGLTEICGPGVAFECLEKHGMHVNEDHVIPEIVDPDTGEPLPMGQTGELVFSTITKEGMPMLRYRTHDLCRLDDTPCACGRTFVRMARLTGRTDDMLVIRGVNVFPTQVETVLAQVKGASAHYLLVVDRVGATDTLEVQVEVDEEAFGDTVSSLERLTGEIQEKLKSVLGLSARVRLVEPRTLPRSEGKAKRIRDLRKF